MVESATGAQGRKLQRVWLFLGLTGKAGFVYSALKRDAELTTWGKNNVTAQRRLQAAPKLLP